MQILHTWVIERQQSSYEQSGVKSRYHLRLAHIRRERTHPFPNENYVSAFAFLISIESWV